MSFHCNDWWTSPSGTCDVHKDGANTCSIHNHLTTASTYGYDPNEATVPFFFPVPPDLHDGYKERSSPERNVQELRELF